jgi:hypothetical protein
MSGKAVAGKPERKEKAVSYHLSLSSTSYLSLCLCYVMFMYYVINDTQANGIVTTYLVAFNLVSMIGWIGVLALIIQHFAAGKSYQVITPFITLICCCCCVAHTLAARSSATLLLLFLCLDGWTDII